MIHYTIYVEGGHVGQQDDAIYGEWCTKWSKNVKRNAIKIRNKWELSNKPAAATTRQQDHHHHHHLHHFGLDDDNTRTEYKSTLFHFLSIFGIFPITY